MKHPKVIVIDGPVPETEKLSPPAIICKNIGRSGVELDTAKPASRSRNLDHDPCD